MATPNTGHAGRKSLQETLQRIEKDRQETLELINTVVVSDDKTTREETGEELIAVVKELFETLASNEQQLDLLRKAKELELGLTLAHEKSAICADRGDETELNMPAIAELTKTEGPQAQARQ